LPPGRGGNEDYFSGGDSLRACPGRRRGDRRDSRAVEPDATGWDAKAAANYLDARAEFWSTWPNAARDRGTFCISCHTTLPFAIARPALRGPLGEREPSPAESKILNNLLTRARNWRDIEPFYPDQTRGIPKTSESRRSKR
jgi:hypothetical protein